MRIMLLAVLFTVASVTPLSAFARGELSSSLPELVVLVPTSTRVITTSSWSRSVDPAPPGFVSSDIFAHGDGLIFFASQRQMCGFDERDGRKVWCAGPGIAPAYAASQVAFSSPDGSVRGVDAKTGAPRWRHSFPPGEVHGFVSAERRQSRGEHVWSTDHDFLVARADTNHAEIGLSGKLLWKTKSFPIEEGEPHSPVIAGLYALQQYIGPGATIDSSEGLFRLGTGGGAVAVIPSAWELLDVQGPLAIFRGSQQEEVQDHFLRFDVWTVGLRDGNVKARYHYEPDYDINAPELQRLWPPGTLCCRNVHIEGDAIYGFIGPKVYRYVFGADARFQRPLLVSDVGTFVGGPIRGAIFVSRPNGVWMLRPQPKFIQARLVAPISSPVSFFKALGRSAYIGFTNGYVRGVDIEDGRTFLDLKSCGLKQVEGVGRRIYVACSNGKDLRTVAFQRP